MTQPTNVEPPHQSNKEPRAQRARGVARLHVVKDPKGTTPGKASSNRATIGRLFQGGAAKVRFMARHADAGLTAALINTAGGLTGGDQFEWTVDIEGDAQCTIVTQACEKVYRAEDDTATVSVSLKLGPGARLDWLPQETILFDGARLNRTFDIQMGVGARLLAVEAVLLGRRAMGENTPFVHLRDRWRVWNGEALIFADEVRLDQALGAGEAMLNGAGAYASILYVGDDHADRAVIVRDLMNSGGDDVQGGVSAFEGKLFCRMLARDGLALRRVMIPILEALRDAEPLPRLWTI